jgi:hypothetical protein
MHAQTQLTSSCLDKVQAQAEPQQAPKPVSKWLCLQPQGRKPASTASKSPRLGIHEIVQNAKCWRHALGIVTNDGNHTTKVHMTKKTGSTNAGCLAIRVSVFHSSKRSTLVQK